MKEVNNESYRQQNKRLRLALEKIIQNEENSSGTFSKAVLAETAYRIAKQAIEEETKI